MAGIDSVNISSIKVPTAQITLANMGKVPLPCTKTRNKVPRGISQLPHSCPKHCNMTFLNMGSAGEFQFVRHLIKIYDFGTPSLGKDRDICFGNTCVFQMSLLAHRGASVTHYESPKLSRGLSMRCIQVGPVSMSTTTLQQNNMLLGPLRCVSELF